MSTRRVLDITEELRPAIIDRVREMRAEGADVNEVTRFLIRKRVSVNYEMVRRWLKKDEADDTE